MRVTAKHAYIPVHTGGGSFVCDIVMIGKPVVLRKAKEQIEKTGRIAGLRYGRVMWVAPVSDGGSLKCMVKKPLYGGGLAAEIEDLEFLVKDWLIGLSQS